MQSFTFSGKNEGGMNHQPPLNNTTGFLFIQSLMQISEEPFHYIFGTEIWLSSLEKGSDMVGRVVVNSVVDRTEFGHYLSVIKQ